MEERSAFYLVPGDQMDRIMAQLDRIEEYTRPKPEAPTALGKILTAKAAAKMMNVNVNTVYVWAREGRIKTVRAGGRVLFPDTAIKEFLEGGQKDEEDDC